MSDLAYRVADLERRVENVVRAGVIEEASYETARLRVRLAPDLLTGWLPWLTQRAAPGETSWDAPEVGEAALVLAFGGHSENGVVLPATLNPTRDHPVTPDIIRRDHSDGAASIYDRTSSAQVLFLPNTGSFKVECGGSSLTLSAAGIELTAPAILLKADEVNLGAGGGEKVARIGDDVANGKIVTGSDTVKSA